MTARATGHVIMSEYAPGHTVTLYLLESVKLHLIELNGLHSTIVRTFTTAPHATPGCRIDTGHKALCPVPRP